MAVDIRNVFARFVPLIEDEMRLGLAQDGDGYLGGHYGMLRYHMGWVDEHFQPVHVDGGKRIRPILCLLACEAVGGDAGRALPAAASLELLHNFSLIHDDIEDDSATRRHRPTVWAIWGRAQAINAGDAMFTLSRRTLHRLQNHGLPADRVLQAMKIYDDACVRLTEGQYLDMSFEGRLDVTSREYLTMIDGKTAALLEASTRVGALIGGADPEIQRHLGRFGRELGMAFQIQDDVLGIWGDETLTGKSAESDILSRKKSLPVVYALALPGVGEALRALYARPLVPSDVPTVLSLLDQAGARQYADGIAQQAHRQALAELEASGVLHRNNQVGQALLLVAEALLDRKH